MGSVDLFIRIQDESERKGTSARAELRRGSAPASRHFSFGTETNYMMTTVLGFRYLL
jgi:hypothetical protein